MLSSSVIKNVSQASHYYSGEDNYYTKEEGALQSEWWGKGAASLNLTGIVNEKSFIGLLSGQLPNGEQLGKLVEGEIKHRPGWDLTFSAPKSVSILALVGGDHRLVDAHREAVTIALAHIEKNCGQARMQIKGDMQFVSTGNVTAALFHHDVSRALDPQLHTHSVIMNMTERPDGKWRSLASTSQQYDKGADGEINGFIERARHHNRYFAKIYETELAFRVKACGYTLNTDTKTGVFEIAGVPETALQVFSKRRQQIEKALAEKGFSGGKASAIATLDTRDKKEQADRSALQTAWTEKTQEIGFDSHALIAASHQQLLQPKKVMDVKSIDEQCLTAILNAGNRLSQFQAAFTLEEVVTDAAKEAIKKTYSVQALLTATEELTKSNHLLSLQDERGKTLLMLKDTLQKEEDVFSLLKDNQLKEPLATQAQIEKMLAKNKTFAGIDAESLTKIFAADRMILIEGNLTKEKLILPIMAVNQSMGFATTCLSPSLIGSKHFSQSVKNESSSFWDKVKAWMLDTTPKHYSVMQFLSSVEKGEVNSSHHPQVLLVDNAHLLSSNEKAALFAFNKDHNTKLILFGHPDTLLSQKIGVSLNTLKEKGLPHLALTPHEETITQNEHAEKLAKVMDHLIEVDNAEDRYHGMANHFARFNQAERKNIWLITDNVKARHQLNDLCHERLLAQGALGKSHTLKTLHPQFIPEGKGAFAATYSKGQAIRFNEAYSRLSIARYEYLRILATSTRSNRVILQKENGTKILWCPDKIAGHAGKVELFNEKEKTFAVNDILVAERSIKAQGIVKGERLFVRDFQKNRLTLANGQGRSLVLDIRQAAHRHLDYGYASTLHRIAHEKPSVLLADFRAESLQTTQRHLLQAVSQPKEVWIYTNAAKPLIDAIEKKTGDRLSVEETVTKMSQIKNHVDALHDILVNHLDTKTLDSNESIKKAIDAVDYAMHHLAEREAGFTHKDLMSVALQYAIGDVTEKTLIEVTLAMEKKGILLRGHKNDGTLWTTLTALNLEKEILYLTKKDEGKLSPMVSEAVLNNHAGMQQLRREQRDAIRAITQSHDRVLAIAGRAGTGKTTMMVTLSDVIAAKDLLKENGYTLHCVAPTHKAVKELTSRGLKAETVDRFLLSAKANIQKGGEDFSKTVLVIDEASMVSNRNMQALLKVGTALQYRAIIPTGDTEQNPAIESGKPYTLIQDIVKAPIRLTDIQRQKDPILKAAVDAIYQRDVEKTFAILKDHLITLNETTHHDPTDRHLSKEALQAKYYEKRIQAIVSDYLALTQKGENVQMIAPSHVDRKAVNAAVRQELNALQLLKGDELSFTVLSSEDMTLIERSEVKNFQVGQIIQFAHAGKNGIKAGDYCKITAVDHTHHLLTLAKPGEKKAIVWQIPKSKDRINRAITVFSAESRHLQVGDKIVWTRSNHREGMLCAESVEVVGIQNKAITIKQKDNTLFTFDGDHEKYQHWDHAYAITTYGSQGGTYGTVLALFESYRKNLMNLKNFLVTITRPEHGLRIYTDHKERLQASITKNSGDKKSSLEVIGEHPRKVKRMAKTTAMSRDKTPMISKSNGLNSPRFDRFAIEKIKAGLNAQAESIAIDVLGSPKERGGHYLKFGKNQGSLVVTIKGEKAGWFNDFETNVGGRDMIKFLTVHANMTKSAALQLGAKQLGMIAGGGKSPSNLIKKPAVKLQEKAIEKESAYEKRRIKLAMKIAGESIALKGTIADRYLKAHRGVDLKELPSDIRFHPNLYSAKNKMALPALIAIARDKDNTIKAIEAIYLDPKTGNKAAVSLPKQTVGKKNGALVFIQQTKNSDAPTLIAEGVVTGLSLAKAIPDANVAITLGKQLFTKLEPKLLANKVIFCLDNDGKHFKNDPLIFKATERLANEKDVKIMVPTSLEAKKQDYNDILKAKGIAAIQKDYQAAISFKEFYQIRDHSLLSMHPNDLKHLAIKVMDSIKAKPTIEVKAYDYMMAERQHSNSKPMQPIKDFEREM